MGVASLRVESGFTPTTEAAAVVVVVVVVVVTPRYESREINESWVG